MVEHRTFPTSAAGLRRALTWIRNRTQDQACLVVVEGTGSYGAGLAEHFTQGGIVVAEAPTIPAARPRGKDDAMDSARIARAVLGLRLDQLCWPRAGGTRTAIRVLVSARDQMGTERTKTINTLTALVRSVDLGVDARKALTSAQITTIAGWRARDEDPAVAACRREAIRLASRIHALGRDLAANMAELRQFTAAEVPELLNLTGVGPVVAGTILLAWSHPGRVRSEAAFAALAGTSPIPASSGNTIRYRLNRGGDRQLNRVLTTTVLVGCATTRATGDYMARRRAEGRTTGDHAHPQATWRVAAGSAVRATGPRRLGLCPRGPLGARVVRTAQIEAESHPGQNSPPPVAVNAVVCGNPQIAPRLQRGLERPVRRATPTITL